MKRENLMNLFENLLTVPTEDYLLESISEAVEDTDTTVKRLNRRETNELLEMLGVRELSEKEAKQVDADGIPRRWSKKYYDRKPNPRYVTKRTVVGGKSKRKQMGIPTKRASKVFVLSFVKGQFIGTNAEKVNASGGGMFAVPKGRLIFIALGNSENDAPEKSTRKDRRPMQHTAQELIAKYPKNIIVRLAQHKKQGEDGKGTLGSYAYVLKNKAIGRIVRDAKKTDVKQTKSKAKIGFKKSARVKTRVR